MRCYYCNAMPYIPTIRDYKPFYIEAERDSSAWDTTTYGMVAQTQPFPGVMEVKELYKNDWKDEHGDDEYVPYSMKLKSFDYTIKFFVKTLATVGSSPIEKLNEQYNGFMDKLLHGEFSIWDSWQERGYRKVRLSKVSIEERDVTDESAWMLFSVTMKVNDPATQVYYSNNHILASS